MTRRLCKLNRHDIASNLGDIHALIASPKYMCRSCSRAASDKNHLCKPAAIPPKSCLDKPRAEQCGLVLESLPLKVTTDEVPVINATIGAAKKAESMDSKKAIKQQKKRNKKLAKALKKQQKLMKKLRKAEVNYQQLMIRSDLLHTVEDKSPRESAVH
ncbi:hypothetical protein [Vibrio tapetis]|uniref:Uncharacterized protein n=1 Tax=Vibrio tapetis subsp. tapetis TaxID=1671868 RepID=A0A2N8ZGT0_9VIBR|nr:hypothetical protein [Vibrio tapetis]SON51124.1 conserved protein of unknown function [Vibrio tapetis subsp. tapetis]